MTPGTDLFSLAGKRALVTGATSGIGKMIATGLVEAGVETWVVARTAGDVDTVTRELAEKGSCFGIVADISSDEDLAILAKSLGNRPLDILVNNAGTNRVTPVEGSGRADFSAVVDLNLTTPFRLVQTVLPNLQTAATIDDPARVINITSIATLDPGPFENYAYSSSKTGLAMLTRHLGRHLAREHISVNAIAPGLFPSRLTEKFMDITDRDEPPPGFSSPLGNRMGKQDDIVGAVTFLSSRAGAWITGETLTVSGGINTVS